MARRLATAGVAAVLIGCSACSVVPGHGVGRATGPSSATSGAVATGPTSSLRPGSTIPLDVLARRTADAVAQAGAASVTVVSVIQASGHVRADGAFDVTATADWVGDRFVEAGGHVYVSGSPAVSVPDGTWVSASWPTPLARTRMAYSLQALRFAAAPGRLLPDLPGATATYTASNDGRSVYTVHLTSSELVAAEAPEADSVLRPSDGPAGLVVTITYGADGLPDLIDIAYPSGYAITTWYENWGTTFAVGVPAAGSVRPGVLVPTPATAQGA